MNANTTVQTKPTFNIENGSYLKAKICGVNVRESRGVKDPNAVYKFYTLIMETSLTSQKVYVNLRGKSIDKGFHERFNDPQYIGRDCMIPVLYAVNRYTKNGQQVSNLEISYFGEDKPIFF